MIAPFVRKPGGGLMSRCCCGGQPAGICVFSFSWRIQFREYVENNGELFLGYYPSFPVQYSIADYGRIGWDSMCIRTFVWCTKTLDEIGTSLTPTNSDFQIRRIGGLPDNKVYARPIYWTEDCDFNWTDDINADDSDITCLLNNGIVTVMEDANTNSFDFGDTTENIFPSSPPWDDMITAWLESLSGFNQTRFSVFLTVKPNKWRIQEGGGPLANADNFPVFNDPLRSGYYFDDVPQIFVLGQVYVHEEGDTVCDDPD